MKAREPEPMEQIDYGRDYQSRRERRHSPSSVSKVVQVESLGRGAWAILAAAIVLASLACALAWTARDRSMLAERETRVLADQLQSARLELAKQGITVNTDDHQ